MPAILFQTKHPKHVFGRWRVPVKFTGESDVIFSDPKFSCALRNTRESFRELYGTVFGPETFSGLFRNAPQNKVAIITNLPYYQGGCKAVSHCLSICYCSLTTDIMFLACWLTYYTLATSSYLTTLYGN